MTTLWMRSSLKRRTPEGPGPPTAAQGSGRGTRRGWEDVPRFEEFRGAIYSRAEQPFPRQERTTIGSYSSGMTPCPGVTATQLVVGNNSLVAENAALRAPQRFLGGKQEVPEQYRSPAIIPELEIIRAWYVVMQDDEVADVLERACICRFYSSRSTGLNRRSRKQAIPVWMR